MNIRLAIEFGFTAMWPIFQTVAVSLWKKPGDSIAGTLPKAFLHESLDYVDACVMYRFVGNVQNQPIDYSNVEQFS